MQLLALCRNLKRSRERTQCHSGFFARLPLLAHPRPAALAREGLLIGGSTDVASTRVEASLCPHRISRPTPVRRTPVVLSPLLREALGRRVGRQGDPGVARLLPHRDGRRGEIRVGKVADGHDNVARKACALPVDGGAAYRTEMKRHQAAAFGCPTPRSNLAGEGELLGAETRLVADHSAGAALALQAVAHRDARWFALNRKVKLPAAAGGVSGGYRHGSAPSLWLARGPAQRPCCVPGSRHAKRK